MPPLRRWLGVSLLAAPFLFLLATSDLSAQAQATTGVIRGTVVSPQGDPVGAAEVRVRNVNTGLERTVTASERGQFVFNLLPVGTYEVTASAIEFGRDVSVEDVQLGLGETESLTLTFQPREVEELVVVGDRRELINTEESNTFTSFEEEAVRELPKSSRDYIDFTKITPGVKVVQGPDGEEISFAGQRGIFNNVSVDGADFNNPFFGEQRGGQRPAFTFNEDAVEEIKVINGGAPAEFGRSSSGFVNVITKSGTNEFEGTAHYFGQWDELSADLARGGGNPPFSRNQFGFTLGGPIVEDELFFFVAYDQQEFSQTKQLSRGQAVVDQEQFQELRSYMNDNFGGALAGDFGPVERTNDARAAMVKLDWNVSQRHHASLKYNHTWSEQVNGTFDVDTWGRSANGVEQDFSNAINGALSSQLSSRLSNEFRFQFAREERPRPYEGPRFPGTDDPFPDTGLGFADGFRFGQPFFLPIDAFDDRWQIVDNLSFSTGDHLFKVGAEWNRTRAEQTFVGFADGRFIFNNFNGFRNYVEQGPTYVECSDGSANTTGTCPAGTEITGPLLLFLQFGPVGDVPSAEAAGTQELVTNEFAAFIQDSWKVRPNLTINYGLRWEGTNEPGVITPPGEVFFSDFIGQSKNGREFPSDGTIPDDWDMFQPRLGITWDLEGDGATVLRANAGLYYARLPQLIFASTRSTNGTIGQTAFRASFFNEFGVTPPEYGPAPLELGGGVPQNPDVFVTSDDLRHPRTFSTGFSVEQRLTDGLAGSLTYNYRFTDDLFRFRDHNAAEFGSPWSTGLPADPFAGPASPEDTLNGVGVLTVLESTARSRYHGFTAGLRGRIAEAATFEANYTLSFDKSSDDNERDPFSFRYASADRLGPEFNWSDRDQRHQVNAYGVIRLPEQFLWSHRFSYNSAQPTSEACIDNQPSGERAATPQDRICENGDILDRNTLRKDNEFFTWDMRLAKMLDVGPGQIELIAEVFNLTNTDNFRDPGELSLLFNFDGTIRSGLGDPRRFQVGTRYLF